MHKSHSRSCLGGITIYLNLYEEVKDSRKLSLYFNTIPGLFNLLQSLGQLWTFSGSGRCQLQPTLHPPLYSHIIYTIFLSGNGNNYLKESLRKESDVLYGEGLVDRSILGVMADSAGERASVTWKFTKTENKNLKQITDQEYILKEKSSWKIAVFYSMLNKIADKICYLNVPEILKYGMFDEIRGSLFFGLPWIIVMGWWSWWSQLFSARPV